MIVDLVRHQLHGVYGTGNVQVTQLMQIEEYETVFQLVSVVEGIPSSLSDPSFHLPEHVWRETHDPKASSTPPHPQVSEPEQTLGFQAFTQSLPPGSMTGAPKKRSCELLQTLEPRPRRGIYAGVLGYLDVGGGGDFSVVIRTAVKIDASNTASATEDTWTIGAGGAITALSDAQSEYEEMLAKFRSTAVAFEEEDEARVEEVEKTDLRGVWSRLMEVEEVGVGEEEDEGVQTPRLLLRTLQDFQAGLLSGVVRAADGIAG